MSWTIAFDFPELDDPVFAGWVGETLGFATTLATAARFETEVIAARWLQSYPASKEYGAVVEVES